MLIYIKGELAARLAGLKIEYENGGRCVHRKKRVRFMLDGEDFGNER
jgi:hypothetical protein